MDVPCKDKDGGQLPDIVLDQAMSDAIAGQVAADEKKLNPWYAVDLIVDGVTLLTYVKVEGGDPSEMQIFD